jgi:hypothetical protein
MNHLSCGSDSSTPLKRVASSEQKLGEPLSTSCGAVIRFEGLNCPAAVGSRLIKEMTGGGEAPSRVRGWEAQPYGGPGITHVSHIAL